MELHLRIVIFFMVMRLSATEEVKKNLAGSVGGNITLPDPVLERGFLSYERTNIAMVNKREPEILEEIYMNRLHWDRNTGFFTLTGLQKDDSGIYSIDSKKGKIFTIFYKLTVYDSVATPTVKNLTVSSEICSLLCSVDRETTLLWFKDEEILKQSSSALSLPLTVHQQDFNSSYRCVAANPAENKTLPVDVKIFCAEKNTNISGGRNYGILFVIFTLSAALASIIIIITIKRKHPVKNKWKLQAQVCSGLYGRSAEKKTKQSAGNFTLSTDTALMAQVVWKDVKRRDRCTVTKKGPVDALALYTYTHDTRQGGILPAVSVTSDRSILTAVSYKLVDHHMITDSADKV